MDQRISHEEVFARDGFVGPVKLMTQQQAAFLGQHLLRAPGRRPVWEKSLATVDPLAYATAVIPVLLGLVRDFIGGDIVLWGGVSCRQAARRDAPLALRYRVVCARGWVRFCLDRIAQHKTRKFAAADTGIA